MGGVEEEVVGKGEQPIGQRAVEPAGHLLHCVLAVRVEVGSPRIADQKGVAGENHPGLIGANPVGDRVGVMGRCVARGRDRLNDGVAQLQEIAVSERLMLEPDVRALGEVGRRPGSRDQLGEA